MKINANSAKSEAEGDNDARHNVPPCLHHLTLCIQFTCSKSLSPWDTKKSWIIYRIFACVAYDPFVGFTAILL